MTAKQVFKNTLIELSKVNAPALKLYEFNYYFNKAISQYINQVYNIFDVNQQTTDDLRVLQTSVYLTPEKVQHSDRPLVSSTEGASNYLSKTYKGLQSLYGAAYQCWLPMDYLHVLNCVCIFEVTKPYDCYDEGTFIQKPATRLTSDAWPLVMDDIYNRPSPEKPYYQIYNQNRATVNTLPTDPVTPTAHTRAVPTDTKSAEYEAYTAAQKTVQSYSSPANPANMSEQEQKDFNDYIAAVNLLRSYSTSPSVGEGTFRGTDINGVYGVETYDDDTLANGENKGGNFPRTFTFKNGHKESLVERTAAQRVGNPSNVRMEIRYGRDDTLFKLREVQVDYIKVPQFIRLTQEQLDLTQDVSQMLEWPDYICQEITNVLIKLIMERTNDPRLANNMQINQTIARPGGQQQQAAQAQAGA